MKTKDLIEQLQIADPTGEKDVRDIQRIRTILIDDDIEWEFEHEGKTERIFEPEKALAHLIINDEIFINSLWYREDLSDEIKKSIGIHVNCNDIFQWACSDGEPVPYDEIENLYKMWKKDPKWGSAVWCMLRRKQWPQPPVEKIIREAGIWNLDEILKDVPYDFVDIWTGKRPKR